MQTEQLLRSHTAPLAPPSAELSIVVPTYSERDNVAELIRRVAAALGPLAWEIIFVDDDSPDGTAAELRRIARTDARVRCVQRIGRRGLSSACVEGMLASAAPFLAVMDADLQHDEAMLPAMLAVLKEGRTDVVVASRYAAGGGIGAWETTRARQSRLATRLAGMVLKAELTDPMSGFFMLRREAFEGAVRGLSAIGFKILLDLFASSPRPLAFVELPYRFRPRQAGESKLDNQAVWDYFMLLGDKLVGHIVPVRFLSFALVGAFGVAVHVAVLWLVHKGLGFSFVLGQSIATAVAMTSNYAINNASTYRDRRRAGWRWVGGWLSFVAACAIGAIANVGVASYLFAEDALWIAAALAGVVVGAVWNYAVTSLYTWGRPGTRRR